MKSRTVFIDILLLTALVIFCTVLVCAVAFAQNKDAAPADDTERTTVEANELFSGGQIKIYTAIPLYPDTVLCYDTNHGA